MFGALFVPRAVGSSGNKILDFSEDGHIAADFRKDQDFSHRVFIHPRHSVDQTELGRISFRDLGAFSFDLVQVSIQLIDAVLEISGRPSLSSQNQTTSKQTVLQQLSEDRRYIILMYVLAPCKQNDSPSVKPLKNTGII